MPRALFALTIFQIRSRIYAWAGLDHNPIYASYIDGMTGIHTAPIFYWLRWDGVLLTFCLGHSEP
jgi:hypothetical protein